MEPNVLLKINVFRCFLITVSGLWCPPDVREGFLQMWGSHTEGPISHSPQFGSGNVEEVWVCRTEGACCLLRSSFEEGGACPWMHWCVRRETLYSILVKTGSQWIERRMGGMCSCLRTLIRILAAEFWVYLSLCRLLLGIPKSSALQ